MQADHLGPVSSAVELPQSLLELGAAPTAVSSEFVETGYATGKRITAISLPREPGRGASGTLL